jgi:hypothetical protein
MAGSEDQKERIERWQRREARRRAERERIQKHGATVRRVYADAVRKRLQQKPRVK